MMIIVVSVVALILGAGWISRRVARMRGPARTRWIVGVLGVFVLLPLGLVGVGMGTLFHYGDWQRVQTFFLVVPCCWGVVECACRSGGTQASCISRVLIAVGQGVIMLVLSLIILLEMTSAADALMPSAPIRDVIVRIDYRPPVGRSGALRRIWLNHTCYAVRDAAWFATLRVGAPVVIVTDPWGNDAFPAATAAATPMGDVVVGAWLYLMGLSLVRVWWAIRPPAAVAPTLRHP